MGWQVFAIGSAIFAALTAIFGKMGVSGINSNMATFIRTIVVLIASALIISLRQEWMKPNAITSKTYVFLILSGLCTGFSWLCYYHALKIGPASRVAPVDKLSVVLVVIFATLFLGEVFTWKVGLGSALIVAGVILTTI